MNKTSQVYAYLFKDQSLVVNDRLELPLITPQQQDLLIHEHAEQTFIARDLYDQEELPEGFQLVPIRQLINEWSTAQFEQASRAVQLLEWKRNHGFCSRCGHATESHIKDHAMVCPACQYHQYPRVQPCVIMAITKGKQILLARSAQRPTGFYSLLAGFVEVGETLEQAVIRETMEETAVRIKNIRYMGSQPWPFPTNLMVAFHAEYDSGDIIPQPGEIAEAAFFDLDNLPSTPFKSSIAYWMIQQIIQMQT